MGWGAKAIPEGGYWAMPKLHAPGAGDLRRLRRHGQRAQLKGVHYAIKSGMLAAETIYRQLKAGSTDFSAYEAAVEESEIGKELYEVAQHEAAVRSAASSWAARSSTR